MWRRHAHRRANVFVPAPGPRHLPTENHRKPLKYHFLHFETAPHNYPTHRRQPMGGRARHSVRAAIDIQVRKLSQLPLSHCFTFKKHIMQVTVCKSVTLAAKAPKIAGRDATGFPLPSTGRGIEGEGWSYPELPPVRFFLFQHPPASKLNTSHKIPELTLLSP